MQPISDIKKQVSALQPIELSAYMVQSLFIIVNMDISVAALKDLIFQDNIFNNLCFVWVWIACFHFIR